MMHVPFSSGRKGPAWYHRHEWEGEEGRVRSVLASRYPPSASEASVRTISISFQPPPKLSFFVFVAYRLGFLFRDGSNGQPLGPHEALHVRLVASPFYRFMFAFQQPCAFQGSLCSFLDPQPICTGVDPAGECTAPERTGHSMRSRTAVLEASERSARHCSSEEAVQRSVHTLPGLPGRVVADHEGQCASSGQARGAQRSGRHRRLSRSTRLSKASKETLPTTATGRFRSRSTAQRVERKGTDAVEDARKGAKMLLVARGRVQASESTGASGSTAASSSSSNRCSSRAFFSTWNSL